MSASYDVLLDLFGRMEGFLKRFEVYSRSCCVYTELADVLVKAVVKVLNIFSIVTKEMEQSRTSELFLRDTLID